MDYGSAKSSGTGGLRVASAAGLRSRATPSIGLREHSSIGNDRTKFVSPEHFRGTAPSRVVSPAKSGMGFAVLIARNDSRTAEAPVNEETAE
jgi:hypothetical protein